MKNKKLFKIINSIPGFGEFSTALFLAEVGDVTRFDNKYQFISFIGIDSVTSQSGVSAYHGPISKTGCKFGRTILFNVITTLLQISAHKDKSPRHFKYSNISIISSPKSILLLYLEFYMNYSISFATFLSIARIGRLYGHLVSHNPHSIQSLAFLGNVAYLSLAQSANPYFLK